MTLNGKVTHLPDGAIGFDTAVPLEKQTIASYVQQGYKFVVRYVSRTNKSRESNQKHGLADISTKEAQAILAGGLSLMVVQHVAPTGWIPTADLGKAYGANAAAYTQAADIPPGVNLWLDLEDIPKGTQTEDTIDYCNAWFSEVAAKGYVPGVYVGFNVWLSPDQLFFDLKCQHYWRAAGNIPDIAHRGYQLFQHVVNPGTKSELDKDVAKTDALGVSALCIAPV